MDNRRLLTTMILATVLFMAWQFLLSPKPDVKPTNKAKPIADFYQPTGNSRQFFTLGSLGKQADSSLLVTLDSRGASVRRIELVQRDDEGEFIIRELENKSGYLGYLELRTDRQPGAVIRCLADGSPLVGASAQWNGSTISPQIGDRLISIDGSQIDSDQQLHQFLASTEPGQTVQIELARLPEGVADNVETPATPELESLDSAEEPADNQTPLPAGETSEDSDSESTGPEDQEDDATTDNSADPSSDQEAAPATAVPLSEKWQKYQVTVELMPRPKKMLGPEYRNTEGWTGVYPSTLELSLQAANEVNWKDLDKAMRIDNWKGAAGEDERGPFVRFTYDLPAGALDRLVDRSIKPGEQVNAEDPAAENADTSQDSEVAADPKSPAMRVSKTFRLAQLPEGESHDPMAPNYHFDMEVEIENLTEKSWDFGYRLNGPVGTSIEGWWYQVKVHGGTWKFFYGAGARDVLVSTDANSYTFYGRPQIVQENKPFPIVAADADAAGRSINYVGLDTHYFNSALIPVDGEPEDSEFICYSGFASAAGAPPGKDRESQTKADVTYRLYKKLSLAPETPVYRQTFRMFAGPKRPELLDKYGLGAAVNYGWFGIFSRPLLWLLHTFHYFLGNYGLAIVVLTIIVKIAVMPISRKALSNAQMMQLLQPELKKINEQYKDDMTQRQLATQQLFKRVKYNPFSGCVLMPLQIPIFIGLYRGLSVDFALRDQPLIPGMEWCSNLAGPDQFWNWSPYLPQFIAGETGFLGPYLNILPLIAVGFFIVQQRMFTPPAVDEQQQMMQRTMSIMMVVMAFMFFKVPSGLCVYIITSSMWSLVERTMIPKPQLPQNVVDSINREIASEGKGKGKVIEGSVVESAGATRLDDSARRELKDRDRDRRRRLRERGRDN